MVQLHLSGSVASLIIYGLLRRRHRLRYKYPYIRIGCTACTNPLRALHIILSDPSPRVINTLSPADEHHYVLERSTYLSIPGAQRGMNR